MSEGKKIGRSAALFTEDDKKKMLEQGKDPFNTSERKAWVEEKKRLEFQNMMTTLKQSNWDNWPAARKEFWLKRDVLLHNQFIYLLKGKEPRSLSIKPTQFDYFPYDFCEFHADVVRIIEDQRVLGTITPVYSITAKTPPEIGFKTIDLVNLALSKGIDVPYWLLANEPTEVQEEVSEELIKRFPFLDREDPFYSTKLAQAFFCWISLYGTNGSVRQKYNQDPEDTMKKADNFGRAIEAWLTEKAMYKDKTRKSGPVHEIFKVVNPDNNPRTKKK